MKEKENKKCKCPFCDGELIQRFSQIPYCEPCKITFTKCECGKLYNEKFDRCPHCNRENPKKKGTE